MLGLHLLSKWTIPSIWSINPFMRPSVIIWEAIFSAWNNKEGCQKLSPFSKELENTQNQQSYGFLTRSTDREEGTYRQYSLND